MGVEQAATALIGLIYDAVENPQLWPVVTQTIAEAMRGSVTCFSIHQAGATGISAAARMDPAFQQSYPAYDSVNIHIAKAQQLLKPGAVISSTDICTDQEVLASDYHDGWLRPQDIFYITGGVVIQEGNFLSLFNSFRSRRAGPFSDEAVSLLTLLMPHLQRAARLHQRLDALAAGAEALDCLTIGVVFTTASGAALSLNQRSRAIVAQKDGIGLTKDGRISASGRDGVALQALIRGAGDAAQGRGLQAGGSLSVHRRSGKRPYSILVSPIRGGGITLTKRNAAVVMFITDPELNSEPDEDYLARAYGLTRAEARLAAILACGRSLNDACEELSIRRTTARTHLQQVFAKMGVRRQSELVALILREMGQGLST